MASQSSKLVFTVNSLQNLVFFVSDYLMYRLPATGVLTSWCARSSPSHPLSLVVFFSYYSAYTVMIFPFLLSFIRLLFLIAPNSRLSSVRLSLPLIFIYPLFFTFFLFPTTGICKQLGSPYPFGSVMVYYYGSYRGIHNSPLYLGNVVVWMFLCLLINAALLLKLSNFGSQLKASGHSRPSSRKVEFSITLTTTSMLLSALLNCVFVVSYITFPDYIDLLTIVKPIGSDCELVVSPWIFYLTHPIFEKNVKTESAMRSVILVSTI